MKKSVLKTIKTGDILTYGFIGDHTIQCRVHIIERKGSFAVFKLEDGSISRKKIRVDVKNQYEYIYPLGVYSMCPIAQAND